MSDRGDGAIFIMQACCLGIKGLGITCLVVITTDQSLHHMLIMMVYFRYPQTL